jgi:pimeloyl-ACP methyl ester carboxylesterase
MTTPLLLVPGLGCTARLYAPQVAALADIAETRIVDHGRHDTIAEIAAAALSTAPPRFALAGLSMGGYVAFEMMRQAPERILRLALLDTMARPDSPAILERRHRHLALIAEGRYGEVTEALLPVLINPERLTDAGLVAVVREMADDTGAERFARQMRAIMGRADSRPTLWAIRCPTLVLVGAEDALTPPELAREMHDGIADSCLVVVPDCGHLSTLERAEAVTAALRAWLTYPG